MYITIEAFQSPAENQRFLSFAFCVVLCRYVPFVLGQQTLKPYRRSRLGHISPARTLKLLEKHVFQLPIFFPCYSARFAGNIVEHRTKTCKKLGFSLFILAEQELAPLLRAKCNESSR